MLRALVCLALAGCLGTRGSTAVLRSFSHEDELREAVVYIRECGTGWLVSERYIVTNAHVVKCIADRGKMFATVDFSNGTQMKATVAAMSSEKFVDLALLQLDGPIENAVLTFNDRPKVPLNSLLVSTGNPTPVTWISTTYRVVKQPDHVEDGLDNILILEGLALPGNSGSPVVDLNGKVVGTIFARAPGFAYAIPVQPYLVTLLRSVSPKRTWP